MPQGERGQIEQLGELLALGGTPELERRGFCGGCHDLDLRVVHFGSPGGLVARDDGAGGLEHGLGLEGVGVRAQDDLAEAAAVAQDEERDLAECPPAVKPAGHGHAPADVGGQVVDEDSHGWHLQGLRLRPECADGGHPVVPPHFAPVGRGLVCASYGGRAGGA